MNNEYEKIVFNTEDGDEEFFIIEQTMLGGVNYILVTDDLDGEDGDFLILKEIGTEKEMDDEFVSYDFVEDENELKSLISIFNELVDDFDLEV
ncbi:MAG: DUF1292 domain-containing protein [Lachnospiraceae bacterium]|nr:DUF1292 domain-containing protein [Lachnospiraceae bacterium]